MSGSREEMGATWGMGECEWKGEREEMGATWGMGECEWK